MHYLCVVADCSFDLVWGSNLQGRLNLSLDLVTKVFVDYYFLGIPVVKYILEMINRNGIRIIDIGRFS